MREQQRVLELFCASMASSAGGPWYGGVRSRLLKPIPPAAVPEIRCWAFYACDSIPGVGGWALRFTRPNVDCQMVL